jgi:hypothetical protein
MGRIAPSIEALLTGLAILGAFAVAVGFGVALLFVLAPIGL